MKPFTMQELKKYDAQLSVRYGYLLMKQLEFERRQRNKALRLARKNEKQANLWVV